MSRITETPATASDQGSNLSIASSPAEISAAGVTASGKSASVPNPSAVAAPNSPKQPSIASLPTGGDDDDDDDYDEDDDDDEDDH